MTRPGLTLILSIVVSFSCFSQIKFEKGYFIQEDNHRVDCLIKNVDWDFNPTAFEYMLSPNTEIKKATIEQVKEFGIDGFSKYVRAVVQMDQSSNDESNFSKERNPTFREERLFLKVLVEGETSLLQFKRQQLIRFFYAKGDTINQLIYKRYLLKDNKLAVNNTFRQQLLVALKCQGVPIDNMEHIKYQKKDLEQIIIKYNECNNYNYVHFEPQRERSDVFNFSIKPGLNISSLSAERISWNADFSNQINFRLGIEAEFILPFNKNKWSLFVEPTYQYFKAEDQTQKNNVSGGVLVSKMDYKSLELPIGIRHYFFINNNSKIFLNALHILDFNFNSSFDFSRSDRSVLYAHDLENVNRNSAIGIGYKYKNKYSLEARYFTKRQLGEHNFRLDYQSAAVIFGYTLF